MLACRSCRYPLSSQDGCAICLDFKKHLVSTDETDEVAPSLAEVGAESIAALRARVRWLKEYCKDNPADSDALKNLVLATNSVAKILDAARKLQDDGIAAVKNMSFLERAKLFIAWYASLPPSYRAQVREQVEKYELDLNKPLQLEEKKND